VSYTWRAPRTQPLDHPRPTHHAHTYGWGTCVADVGVEVATGRVRVLRAVVALDAGRVINPALLRGQVEGGVVMGQGYALLERCPVRDGMPVGLRLDACCLPTAVDAVPTIDVVAIESPEPCGPFGARGIGEIAMIPIVPAITAAIHAACGAWIDAIPAVPERVRAAIDAIGSSSRGP
jgi:CO/xanthine dehydrogenase Mo-binding subunit